MGRYDEAQVVGMDALTLAEKLDLHELASEVITTLSGLKKSGPKEGLRAALADAVDRAEESGALASELRARYLLGRSFEDWAEFDETERGSAAPIDRAVEAGTPFAPYGFEARWQLAWVYEVQGRWDEMLGADRRSPGQRRRRSRARCSTSLRLRVEQARGVDVARRAAALRKFWAREGGVAINASSVEMDAGRAARRRRRRDRGVRRGRGRAQPDLARVVQRPDPARRGHHRRGRRRRCRACQRPSARRTSAQVDRIHADGHIVLDRYSDPSGHWGPEGRAWVKRLDAETLRARWLAGVDAPPLDALVDTWRDAVALFEDFGHVYELARVRATLAGILRASGDLAGARELGDLAREAAHRLGAQPLLDELRAIGGTPVREERALRRADPARERDPGAGRRGPVERRDRQAAVHQRQDRVGPRLEHPRQARRGRPHRGRRDRPAARPDPLSRSGERM